MVKLHLDPTYLETRRQQLVADIRRLAQVRPIGRELLEQVRRRQRALNIINKRLARLERATQP
jgi:hypothetical protein